MIPDTKFLPLVIQLGKYLKLGLDHYALLRTAGALASPEMVANFVEDKMSDWHPNLAGKMLLDPETKKAAARFLAGVAVNFAGG